MEEWGGGRTWSRNWLAILTQKAGLNNWRSVGGVAFPSNIAHVYMSPTHEKTASDDTLGWREETGGAVGGGGEQQENTRPPPIFGWHACSSLMFQVWKKKKKEKRKAVYLFARKKSLSVCVQCGESGGGVWLPHSVGCCRLCSTLLCSSSAFIFSFTMFFLYPLDLRWNSLLTEISILLLTNGQLVRAWLFVL